MVRLLAVLLLTLHLAYADSDQKELKSVLGVPHSKLVLYQPTNGNFHCFDGSNVILYSQLNDNYCDCADGSDEPGTSACNNGHFFCANVGHTAGYIYSSRVNDHICDCCDGSDEYDGSVTCPNLCDELGRAARVQKEKISAIARKGFAKRQQLAQQGQALRDEKLKDVEPLKAEKVELEVKVRELEAKKNAAEEAERKLKDAHHDAWMAVKNDKKKVKAEELFKEIDTNADGKITADEIQKLVYIDTNHDGAVSDDEVKAILSTDDADIAQFTSNIYDILTTARKGYEEEQKISKQLEADKAKALESGPDADDDLIAEEDKAHVDEHHDEEHGDEHVEEEEEDRMPPYSEETQAASDASNEARREYDELSNKVREIEGKIHEAESFASADFGADFAWAPLKGQCYEVDVMQYTYKLCPFDRASQKDKNGYGDTGLGNFKDWTGDVPRKFSKQTYHDGQQCWNGPKRSTEVIIECGEEHEIYDVSEPAKCEYQFKFRTPAACNDPDNEEPVHQEL